MSFEGSSLLPELGPALAGGGRHDRETGIDGYLLESREAGVHAIEFEKGVESSGGILFGLKVRGRLIQDIMPASICSLGAFLRARWPKLLEAAVFLCLNLYHTTPLHGLVYTREDKNLVDVYVH